MKTAKPYRKEREEVGKSFSMRKKEVGRFVRGTDTNDSKERTEKARPADQRKGKRSQRRKGRIRIKQ